MKTTILMILPLLALAPGVQAQQQPHNPLPASEQLRLRAGVPMTNFAVQRTEAPAQPQFRPPLPIPVPPDADQSLSPEASRHFATRIQPVLANLCASCHARASYEGEFKLKPMLEGYANPQVTEHNMRVAAKFINRANPDASDLLNRAVSAHGGRKDAPLFSRQHPAYLHLNHWAILVAPPVPGQTRPLPDLPENPNSIRLAGGTALPGQVILPGTTAPTQPTQPTPTIPGWEFGTTAPARTEPRPVVLNPEDPYDPGAFNQYARPAPKPTPMSYPPGPQNPGGQRP
jgi:hypothetical protein